MGELANRRNSREVVSAANSAKADPKESVKCVAFKTTDTWMQGWTATSRLTLDSAAAQGRQYRSVGRSQGPAAIPKHRLHDEHYAPDDRKLAAGRSKVESFADQPKMRRAEHHRGRVDGRPSRVDTWNEEERAHQFCRDHVIRHKR